MRRDMPNYVTFPVTKAQDISLVTVGSVNYREQDNTFTLCTHLTFLNPSSYLP